MPTERITKRSTTSTSADTSSSSPAKWFKQNCVDGESNETDVVNNENSSRSRSIYCTISPCNGQTEFREPADYELHYSTTHCYVCKECAYPGRTMPDKRILEMHFLECHDPFFEVKKSRGEPVFQCLVIGCPKAFATAKGRRLHLIDLHKYPKTFDFEVVHRGIRSQKQKIKDEQERQSANQRQQEQTEIADQSYDHRENTRKLKTPTNVSPTCSNIHDQPRQPDRIPSTDDPMDCLSTLMGGLKFRVPKEISFGHHRQKGFPQSVKTGYQGRRNQAQDDRSRKLHPVAAEMELDAEENPEKVSS